MEPVIFYTGMTTIAILYLYAMGDILLRNRKHPGYFQSMVWLVILLPAAGPLIYLWVREGIVQKQRRFDPLFPRRRK